MIKKDKLLVKINTLIDLEKSIVPLLNKHISSSLFFSNLEKDKRNILLEQLQNMVVTGVKHIEIINNIKEEVTKGGQDVY